MNEDEFFSAIANGDEEVVSRFIRTHPERWKEAANELGYSSLHFALDAKTAEFLISAGAGLEAVDKWGYTPLLRAVQQEKSAVVAVLIEHGCNIFAEENNGIGALEISIGTGALECAKQLLECGVKVDHRTKGGFTSLHWACQVGHVEIAEFLISAGASLEAVDESGCTPFLRAVVEGKSAVAATLIDRGCNVSAKTKVGNGALALGSGKDFLNLLQTLVLMGIGVNEADQDHFTSLHWACREGRAETAKYLVSAGADIDATNKFGRTPLAEAQAHNHDFVVDYLLRFVSETAARGSRYELEGGVDEDFNLIINSKTSQSSDEEVPSDQENEVHFQEIYDDALKRGSVTVNRSRVIVTGQDGAGKSCLVDSLLNRPFERDNASTEGEAVAMTHTATSGWVATDSKDHLDPLIAQGVYSSMNQQRFIKLPERLHVERPLQNVSSESVISGAAVTESGFQTSSPKLSLAPPSEELGKDLKAVGIEAKTLTPNQQELVRTFLVNKPSEDDIKRQSLGVRDIWDLGGQEIYLATHSALMPENETFCLTMYMVVMDISKSLSDKAESFHRSSKGEVVDQTNELGWIRTNGDFPFYWFGSITAAHEQTTRDSHWLGQDEEVDSPPVFAIGSHRDVVEGDKNRFPNAAAVD